MLWQMDLQNEKVYCFFPNKQLPNNNFQPDRPTLHLCEGVFN